MQNTGLESEKFEKHNDERRNYSKQCKLYFIGIYERRGVDVAPNHHLSFYLAYQGMVNFLYIRCIDINKRTCGRCVVQISCDNIHVPPGFMRNGSIRCAG